MLVVASMMAQRCNLVPFYQRRSKQMTHGAEESIVADIVVSSDWMADLLLCRKEIPNHEKGSQTACGSGANQLRPLRRVTILTKIHCI